MSILSKLNLYKKGVSIPMKSFYFYLKLISKVLLVTMLYSSCKTVQINAKTSQGLFQRAQQEMKQGYYPEALKTLLTLKQKFPYSSETSSADLLRADIYLEQDLLEEANGYYINFISLYPQHKDIEYAYYKQVKSWEKRVPQLASRDLSLSSKVLKLLDSFLKKFPNSSYKNEVVQIRDRIDNQLREKELQIAQFYFNKKQYTSALARVKFLIRTYGNGHKYKDTLILGKLLAQKTENKALEREYQKKLNRLKP